MLFIDLFLHNSIVIGQNFIDKNIKRSNLYQYILMYSNLRCYIGEENIIFDVINNNVAMYINDDNNRIKFKLMCVNHTKNKL